MTPLSEQETGENDSERQDGADEPQRPQAMADLPTGTITFLFTDIEGSTRLWEEHPERMRLALGRHDALLRAAVETHHGEIFKTMGDAVFAAFATPSDALKAALEAQQALRSLPPSATETSAAPLLKVRAALHTGRAEHRAGDYFGPALNRVARLLIAGHGGQVLLSQATADLVRDALPRGVTLRDLGVHRLRDLTRSEAIFQLLHPDLSSDLPPLRSLQAFAHNLPVQLTSFLGRERELAEIKRLLATTRLLTLTGTGGVGKTRLALQVAADLLEEYPDGVWLVELAPLMDPALQPLAVASALGVQEEPNCPLLATLSDYLRPRKMLLLLDNSEHLLSGCAQVADTLLRNCPRVQVLASSREALGIAGELTWRVPSLPVPDLQRLPSVSADLPSALIQYEAVRFFSERAAFSQPGFAVTAENAWAVAEVCQRLDGIPLAIELAAARLTMLSVEQIAARLGDRFRLLTGGSRTALPRQQTLRACIDWSYDLLSEAERLLFRRLSVFAGGCTLEAAEAVGTGEEVEAGEVLDLLGQLVGKSVVMMDEPHPASARAARYRLLETLRQYGQDRLLESGAGEAARGQHLGYFLGLAEEGESGLHGVDQAAWLERLDAEHDNLRAALAWAAEAEEIALGLRLGGALWRFWSMSGYAGEGRRQLARLLTLAGSSARPTSPTAEHGWRARALLAAGSLSLEAGDYWGGRHLSKESLGIWRAMGDMAGIADSLAALGEAEQSQGGYVAARSLYQQCLAIRRELGDRWGIASSLRGLGYLCYYQGDYDLARELGEAALEIRRELGDRRGIAHSLTGLAMIAEQHGDYETARSLYEESLAISRELGNKTSVSLLLGLLGGVARVHGEYARATELLEDCLAIRQAIGELGGVANVRHVLGQIALDQGEHGRAAALFEESLAVYRKQSDLRGIAWALVDLGTVALRQGDWETAARDYRESLALRRDLNDRSGIAECLEGVAALASAMRQAERAARLYGAAEGLREALGAPPPPSEQEANRGNVCRAREMLQEERFAAAWAQGRAMTLEQALACALEKPPSAET